MATGLGLRIGTYESVAAVLSDHGVSQDDEATPEYIVRDTVLYMNADGESQLGGTAPDNTEHTVTDFLAKVGDPGGVVAGDQAFRPEDLVATAMFGLIEASAPHLVPPSEIVAVHPAQWTPENVDALREALDYLGLSSVALMSEADAIVAPGGEPAQAAARVALAAAGGGASTEEFPVAAPVSMAGPMVIAPAYSALADPPTPLPAAGDAPPSKFARFRAAEIKKTPVLVAAAAAAILALTTAMLAVALTGGGGDTAVPEVAAAPQAPTTQVAVPALPRADLPTVQPAPVSALPAPVQTPYIEPVAVPVPVVEAPPPVPPAPPATDVPPAPDVPPPTDTAPPTTTPPPVTTPPVTTPPPVTTTPEATTVPETTPPVVTTPPVTTSNVTPTQAEQNLFPQYRRNRIVIDPEVLIPFEFEELISPPGNTVR